MWLLARQGDELEASVRRLSAGRMALSAVLAAGATTCLARVWLALLGGLGVVVGRRDAATVFYLSQLGKYVPGSVWPVAAQVHLGGRWGAPRRAVLAASLLLLVVMAATGIAVGALLLPWTSPEGLRRYWWLLLLLAPLVALLHPRALTALLARAGRAGASGTDPTVPVSRVSGRGVARAVGWAVVGWVLLGAHLSVLLAAFGPVGPSDVAAAVGGIALAWAAGLAFVPAPAGVGVREGVLLLALAPTAGHDAALTVAVASRVLLVLTDVALAGAAWASRAARRLSDDAATTSARGREGSG